MDNLSFTLPEILSLIGLTQCVYLVVHIIFQARKISAAGLPLLFFAVLGTAFLADAMQSRIELWTAAVYYVQWAAWFLGPPLSVLLVIQMADLNKLPPLKDFWVLLLLPLSFLLSSVTVSTAAECPLTQPCEDLKELLNVMGLMAGTISLLVIFSKKDLFKNIKKQKYGVERYWLILALVILNTLFLSSIFAAMTNSMPSGVDVMLLRTVLGLGFVYLVSTNLLRIFPPETKTQAAQMTAESLSAEERALAMKIEKLLDLDKVYQEPTYARSDLARECDASEMLISRVINVHFQKSFPQIMNERRIEDAKRLLSETDAAVKVVSEEVGFNSLPSFNRVFKDLTGESPGQYRKNTPKSA
jgi:AraC-like DNA-binding protein